MNDNNNVQKPERRKVKTPGIITNRICLCVVAILFFAVAALNLFQFNRPTVSESENRELAKMPEFSFTALFDGSYFEGVSDHLKDTFIARESLVKLSTLFDNCKGFVYKLDGEDYRYFGPQGETDETQAPGEETTRFVITLPPMITTEEPATSDPGASDITTSPDVTGEVTGSVTDITTGPDESSSPTDITTEPVVTTEEPFSYVSLKLDKNAVELNVDNMVTLNATLITRGVGTADALSWSVSDSSLVTMSASGNSATIMATKQGNVTVTVTVGVLRATCAIKINPKSQEQIDQGQEITGSVFAYGGAIYQKISYGGESLRSVSGEYSTFLQYLKIYFPNASVSYMPTPHATLMLDTAKITKAGRDQGLILTEMGACINSSINYINVYYALKAHDDEYLYFRSDHHWTHLGAYYAYTAFCESKGLTPTPLSAFNKVTVNSAYAGSYSNYLKTHNISTDELIVYNPTKAHTMTVTYIPADAKSVGAPSFTRNTCLVYPTWKSYMVFCGGDRPLATITVPANSKENGGSGKSIIVIKDSYGSAFATYLCEHYEKIYVIDPRYFKQTFGVTLQDYFAGQQIDDILLTVNIQMANSTSWLRSFFWPMIGIKLN